MTDLVHVKGLDQLQKLLDQLPAKVERNVLRGALRAAARVIEPVAKGGIRQRSGELAKSLRVSVRARRGTVTAAVKTDLFYARFVEYGTRAHWISVGSSKRAVSTLNRWEKKGLLKIGENFVGTSVAHPGAQPRPFLRPALDTQAGAAVMAAGEYIKQRLATKEGLDAASDVVLEAEEV